MSSLLAKAPSVRVVVDLNEILWLLDYLTRATRVKAALERIFATQATSLTERWVPFPACELPN